MKRREFITLLGGSAAWLLAARAQQPSKLPTIGLLGAGTRSGWTDWVAAFVQRLQELGWIEGRTVAMEVRWAEGRSERYIEIAAEFVRLKVDVIVTVGKRSRRCKAGHIGHPRGLRGGCGPTWDRFGRESGATGRQHHRPVDAVSGSCCQATGITTRSSTRSPPVGGHGQCQLSRSRTGDRRGLGSGPHARRRR